MSQLSTYLQLLIQKLAQSNLGFHTESFRIQSINEAILKIADNYEVPELRVKPLLTGIITFVNNVTDIPADFLRMIKLWDVVQPTLEYTYVINDLFDQQAPNNAQLLWTTDYDPSTNTQRFFITTNSISPVTLNMRYIKLPKVLNQPNDESGLTSQWDNAIAYKAASILLVNERNASSAIMEENAVKEIEKAYEAIRKVGGVKTGERLRSRFEKYPLLNAAQV